MDLRVAMVVDRFPQETFLAQQVAGLLGEGVDVHILCQIRDDHAEAWSLLDGFDLGRRIHPWPERGDRRQLALRAASAVGRSLQRDRSAAARAMAAERSSKSGWPARTLFDARVLAIAPDVVHFQFADLALRRLHITRSLNVAVTASFRGYDLAYAGLDDPNFYDELWPNLDGAHTLGQDLRQLAQRRGCPSDVDWTIIAPAVDLSLFTPPDRLAAADDLDRPMQIVSVGRLHWKKGHLDALAAVARVRAAGHQLRYRIVGAGPAEEQVRWAIQDLDLADTVELLGPLDSAGVRDELARADVFLHAALTEGFGNSVLEAQAMALPVVCTDAEGLAENVSHGVTGFVVPRRNPEALADKLSLLLADPETRRRLGDSGRSRVAEHFELADQTEAFIRFFSDAADRVRRAGPRTTR